MNTSLYVHKQCMFPVKSVLSVMEGEEAKNKILILKSVLPKLVRLLLLLLPHNPLSPVWLRLCWLLQNHLIILLNMKTASGPVCSGSNEGQRSAAAADSSRFSAPCSVGFQTSFTSLPERSSRRSSKHSSHRSIDCCQTIVRISSLQKKSVICWFCRLFLY